ncbi:MAG: DUF2029 domain-containing protein [Proteobacteria bacterium]|nr:DUF2029 domain-containing protein [Pseudomonadota bacterium]
MAWMPPYPENKITLFQRLVLVVGFLGMVLSLSFVYTRLRFFYGVDYHMFYTWQAAFLKTGIFFPKDTVFYNFPLTVVAFGPYGFLPMNLAVALKCIQTLALGAFSLFLVEKIRPGLMKNNGMARFVVYLISVTFVMTQLFYLNIYVEVVFCLLLSQYFLGREKLWLAAFFVSLALIFKVFLLPLILAPLITRKYGFFWRIVTCLVLLCLLSLMIFGWHTHVDMVRAMSETYSKMRVHGIGYPVVSDGFAGWQDFFNKLVKVGLIRQTMVLPLTVTSGMLYVCLTVYVLFRMVFLSQSRLNNPDFYANVFASLVILALGFNFRFDHGVLFLTAVGLFSSFDRGEQGRLTLVLFLLTLSGLLVDKILSGLGFQGISGVVSSVFCIISFQFIGINGLVFLVVSYWSRQERIPNQS